MDGLLGQQGAVDFHGRQTVQSLCYSLIGHLQGLLHGLALYQFGCHGAGSYRRSAAEGLEPYLPDHTVLIYIQKHPHDISALGITHGTYTAGIFQFSHISGILKMIHHFCTIHTIFLSSFTLFSRHT